MKLTGAQIVQMNTPGPGAPRAPLRQLVEADLPCGLSLRIARLARDLAAEFQAFEAIRGRLIRKLGAADPSGQTVSVSPDKMSEFAQEWGEALRQEVEINRDPIHVSDPEMAGLRLSPLAILALEPAITFGEAEKPAAPDGGKP